MRILFLTHYFPPEVNAPASRTFEHCREWVRAGHEVTVLTCSPNHPQGKVFPPYRNKLWQTEEIEGIRVVRVWIFLAANAGFLKRTASYASYALSAIFAASFLDRADVVIATSPQFFCGLAGYPVSRMKRAPWFLEIRDLWPDSIETVGAMKNRSALRFLQALERFAYRNADRIISVTDSFVPHIASCGAKRENVSVIKNGVDLSFFSEAGSYSEEFVDERLEEAFVAAYVGTHGMAHSLETVLKAAELLRERKDIRFLLVGDGAERERLLNICEEKALENVVMLGQQPKARMPAIWSKIDASLVTLKRSPVFQSVIPSKIVEALAMQKPVILAVEGESAALLRLAEAGVAIEPENASQLAHAVRRLADNPELRTRMGENGREFVERFFDRKKLAIQFLEVLEDARVSPSAAAVETARSK